MSFGGYKTSGQVYYETICTSATDASDCKYMRIYAADSIEEDNWNMNVTGAYGILGYGPNSPFWAQYIDPDTDQALYSIMLEPHSTGEPLFLQSSPQN